MPSDDGTREFYVVYVVISTFGPSISSDIYELEGPLDADAIAKMRFDLRETIGKGAETSFGLEILNIIPLEKS